MRHTVFIFILMLSCAVYGQTIWVEGSIIDSKDGQSLPYATVKSSSGESTICNENGIFKIQTSNKAELTFSYVGYESQRVTAARCPRLVKLAPLETSLEEVSVVSMDERVKNIIKTAHQQLNGYRQERANFFYRQLSSVNGQPSSMTEAFINARPAMMIRDMELLTGRYATPADVDRNHTYAGNFIYFSGISMLQSNKNDAEWEDIVPLLSNYRKFYKVTCQVVGDTYVLRFKPKDNFFRPILDCTLVVDIGTLHLRKASGSVRQMSILHMAGTHLQKELPIKMNFTCHYNSNRGFCEIESVSIDIKYHTPDADYAFKSLFYNVGTLEIEDKKPLGNIFDLRKQIEKVKFNAKFWDDHETVKRTEIESNLNIGSTSINNGLIRWAENMERFNSVFPQEKVYLHLDNTGYFMGETIWMKAYVVRADSHAFTDMSRVLYVDLVSPSGEVVETRKLLIENGQAEGSIELKGLRHSGFYEIRAYTRYMTNWDAGLEFSRVIPVFNEPEHERDYTKTVIDKTDYRKQLPDLREQAEKLKTKDGFTVRFYPEGGHFVLYRRCRMAFEVLDKQGLGVKLTASVRGHNGVIADSIKTNTNGWGRFNIMPTELQDTLVLTDSHGHLHRFPLPEAEMSGAVLTVNVMPEEQVDVSIQTSPNLNGSQLGMVLMNRGNIEFFKVINMSQDTYQMVFKRDELSEGVNRILLFDKLGNILADRLFFIFPEQAIEPILFQASGQELKPMGKTGLDVLTRPKSAFSMSIRDYETEVNGPQQTAVSWLLLSSELRGFIEHPEYYLESDDPEHRRATDLLMMIQGWHRYNARQMMTERTLSANQPIEDALFLFGQLRKGKKTKLLPDSITMKATLYNGLGEVLRGETVTDSVGKFVFRLPDCVGPWRMALRSTKDDKPQNYYVSLDRQPNVKPRFIYPAEQRPTPLADADKMLTPTSNFDELLPMELRENLLSEVTVKAKRRYRDLTIAWKSDETVAQHAGIRYDCQKEIENYTDTGREVPNIFQWLQERNEFFHGDGSNVFDGAQAGWYITDVNTKEETEVYNKYPSASQQRAHHKELLALAGTRANVPDCMDEECSNVMEINLSRKYIGFLTADPSFRPQLLPNAGLSYKNRPIVWVLNNNFYAVTQCPNSVNPTDIERLASPSLETMPDELGDFKSIYISEEEADARRYIISSQLLACHPVTVFLYSDGSASKSEKGVRNTYFEGFSVDAYEMPGYKELPPSADFRRTLYWNPYVVTDEDGKAHIDFYNSGTCRSVSISAEGISSDGHILIYKGSQDQGKTSDFSTEIQ